MNSPPQITLYLVRHAPVTGQEGRIYGDDAAIDPGQVQHELQTLAKTLPAPDKALWYTSGVDRTRKTAHALLSVMGHHKHNPAIHQGFREQNFGDLIGKTHRDITSHLQFIDGKIFAPTPPNGETIDEFTKRLHHALLDIRHKVTSVAQTQAVIITHGGAIRAAHAAITGADFIALETPPLSVHQINV